MQIIIAAILDPKIATNSVPHRNPEREALQKGGRFGRSREARPGARRAIYE